MKKYILSSTCVLLCFLSGCATLKFEPSHITKIGVRDGERVRQLDKAAEIAVLVGCFDRSVILDLDSDDVREQIMHGSAIDLVADKPVGGRWLYDKKEGRLMKTDHSKKLMYVLRPTDRDTINKLFFE